MRYEHTPRPEVEDHFHIRDLIEKQEGWARDRTLHRQHETAANERRSEAAGLPLKATMPFWCVTCKDDFMAETIREDTRDWNRPEEPEAMYRTKCPKGHWCLRHGTDKHRDKYFERSRLVAADRGRHAADVLQPWDSGYDMLYRNKNKHRP